MKKYQDKRVSAMPLCVALQGGGAHGAFTWGVLDRLLEEPSIEFSRISGTSAGALNGAALATGLACGDRAMAKKNLASLWQKTAEIATLPTLMLLPFRKPTLGLWDDSLPLLSPYVTNPIGIEALRYVVEQVADIDALRSSGAPALYVNAVNVHSGATRTFGPDDISIEALLASACAPQMFGAVKIDGESYWDGSYAANPVISPLYNGLDDLDLLLVELTPLYRCDVPISAKNIMNRVNEIASVGGLVAEMNKLQESRSEGKNIRTHLIALPSQEGNSLSEPSLKRGADWLLFETLRQEGRKVCEKWLFENKTLLGGKSTVDIESRYIKPFRFY